MSPALRRALTVAGVVLLLGGAGAAGFLAWRWTQPPPMVNGEVEPGCDLHRGPCAARFPDGGRLEVSVTPRPIPLVTPIAVEVRLTGLETETVEIDFHSPDMYMGYNRRPLAAQGDGRYTGRAVLPVCVRDRMRWQLQVTARSPQGVRGARFDFETVVNKPRS
jgi:hypothetical protein